MLRRGLRPIEAMASQADRITAGDLATAEIAAAHGGTAHATPVRPHGLAITLTLPVGPPPGQRAGRELVAAAVG